MRPVCLTDYRAPVAQVTRVTNLAGVELHVIASAKWLISDLERKRRWLPPSPPPQKNTHRLPPCLSPALTSSSQDSPSSRRQEALKRSKPRPGAVARPGNTGERLSAPQPYFLASCRIAAVLHFASFLNALGFDFDISDPPRFLQKQGGRTKKVKWTRKKEREKGGGKRGKERNSEAVKRSTDWFLFSQLHNWPVQRRGGENVAFVFNSAADMKGATNFYGFPRNWRQTFFTVKEQRAFYGQDHTKWTDSKSLPFVLPQKT